MMRPESNDRLTRRRHPGLAFTTIFLLFGITAPACGGSSSQASTLDLDTVGAEQSAQPAERPVAFPARKGLALYWMLGFLDEDPGRRVFEKDDLVAVLYCSEGPRAGEIRRVLERVQREVAPAEALRQAARQECLTEFRSGGVAKALNALYVDRDPAGQLNGQRVFFLRASRRIFDSVGRDERLAFLSGAYYRYGRDGNTFGFSNAYHKADLVAELLRETGASNVVRETSRDRVPFGNVVRFAATPELRDWLRMVP